MTKHFEVFYNHGTEQGTETLSTCDTIQEALLEYKRQILIQIELNNKDMHVYVKNLHIDVWEDDKQVDNLI